MCLVYSTENKDPTHTSHVSGCSSQHLLPRQTKQDTSTQKQQQQQQQQQQARIQAVTHSTDLSSSVLHNLLPTCTVCATLRPSALRLTSRHPSLPGIPHFLASAAILHVSEVSRNAAPQATPHNSAPHTHSRIIQAKSNLNPTKPLNANLC